MPEGPEVFVLANALRSIGFDCKSVGKHLVLKDFHTGEWFDFSFGLEGGIFLDDKMHIHKIETPDSPSGYKLKIKTPKEVEEKLGLDWMKATEDDLKSLIETWKSRKRQIGHMLIDQKEICGIGRVWSNMILKTANIEPHIKCNVLEFLSLKDALVKSLFNTREHAKKRYIVGADIRKFVNEWP